MIRIALCDDEQGILDEVSLHIKEYADKRQTNVLETVCFQASSALLSALEDARTRTLSHSASTSP